MTKKENVLEKAAKAKAADEDGGKEKILAAIRLAAEELGRAPSRGDLRRITGMSHYRVLAEFPTLREAVRAAGLEPNPKGEKISTEDLLADWKRVAEKLGRRPSRAEYVREGKYSAGALTVRFGSWGGISTTKGTEEHREKKRFTTEARRHGERRDRVIW
jgi:Homing endonuclease associated repeat